MIALHPHASPSITDAPRPLGQALRVVVGLFAAWAERRRQRRALLALNDAMLHDIGIGRADAWREGSKPFWRD